MPKRIYWSDIVECEDQLFENLDALVAVATETPECFDFWFSEYEIVSVEVTDQLEITYTTIDDYDDNGDEIRKTEVEKLDYSFGKELAVLVP
jgi:RecB family exonuclease